MPVRGRLLGEDPGEHADGHHQVVRGDVVAYAPGVPGRGEQRLKQPLHPVEAEVGVAVGAGGTGEGDVPLLTLAAASIRPYVQSEPVPAILTAPPVI